MPRRGGPSSKWIRPEMRRAIYHRDGYCCVYCGKGVEDGAKLTLDHVRCRNRGGNNKPGNSITSCVSCNSAKQDMTMSSWFRFLREKGIYIEGLRVKIRRLTRTPLDLSAPANLFHEARRR